MPSMPQHTLSLYELNMLVKETIELSLNDEYWVEAELSEVRESRGHCYMELIQYDHTIDSAPLYRPTEFALFQNQSAPAKNQPIARASAKCWKSVWLMAKPYFRRITGHDLRAGMKVMLRVYAQFHESYGFSWIVTDINPEYTMGDMQRKRQEIIAQLKREGVFELQKQLSLPLFAQRIAVISSATAAGYGDFSRQLHDNERGFCFHTELFQATMQGEQTEQSIIAALDAINQRLDEFDVVVIIRGGGATTDLSGFDTLLLAENVANFPLPVITGIGHERDESILDMISHTRVKTPTAAAAYLIDHLTNVADRLDQLCEAIVRHIGSRMEYEKLRLSSLSVRLPLQVTHLTDRQLNHLSTLKRRMAHAVDNILTHQSHRLDLLESALPQAVWRTLDSGKHRLTLLSQRAEAADPALLLRRGYSITTCNGRLLRNATDIGSGDTIETLLSNGTITSIVK